jgi:hypothetical protein
MKRCNVGELLYTRWVHPVLGWHTAGYLHAIGFLLGLMWTYATPLHIHIIKASFLFCTLQVYALYVGLLLSALNRLPIKMPAYKGEDGEGGTDPRCQNQQDGIRKEFRRKGKQVERCIQVGRGFMGAPLPLGDMVYGDL